MQGHFLRKSCSSIQPSALWTFSTSRLHITRLVQPCTRYRVEKLTVTGEKCRFRASKWILPHEKIVRTKQKSAEKQQMLILPPRVFYNTLCADFSCAENSYPWRFVPTMSSGLFTPDLLSEHWVKEWKVESNSWCHSCFFELCSFWKSLDFYFWFPGNVSLCTSDLAKKLLSLFAKVLA